MDTGPTIEEVDGKPTLYVSSINDDPSESQVEKQCSDIVVNDITIPVDVDGDEKNEDKVEEKIEDKENVVGQEVKYDNVELIQETNEENKEDRIKNLFTNMEKINKNDEVNVVKDTQIK